MDKYIISVIVCTYNRSKLLDKCLSSLCNQVFKKTEYEILVVDNNSSDNTREIVTYFAKMIKNIRYIFEKNQGLSYARNRGCYEAHGRYLAFIDDDAVVPSEYLFTIKKIIDAYQPDILGGPVYPYYTSPKPHWFKDKYEIRKYARVSGFSQSCQISGSNFVIRKNLLIKLGMFDTEFGVRGKEMGLGEERLVLEIYRKRISPSEQKIYYSVQNKLLHHVPAYKMSIIYLLKRSFLGGKVLGMMEKKLHPDLTNVRYDNKGIVVEYIKMICDVIVAFFDDFKTQHIRKKVDYIDLLRLVFFRIGVRVGRLHYTMT